MAGPEEEPRRLRDALPPSGTRDFLAPAMKAREAALAVIREAFERHGFEPLETPALERLDVLFGKYGEEGENLIFKILRRGERGAAGEADLGLRYDFTVPLARVVANHADRLPFPYRRYQIGPVWRAERPGRARYREFYQCDIDIVGSASPLADAEVILAATDALHSLGLPAFTVELNSRKVLFGLLQAYGVPAGLERSALVALDKLDKIGSQAVREELVERGVLETVADRITGDAGAPDAADRAREAAGQNEAGAEGLREVDEVAALLEPLIEGGEIRFAPFMARGLDYYTGPIFEVLTAGLGVSIASGGRYDDLLGGFGEPRPATGGSLGLERILLLLEELRGPAEARPDVLVTVLDPSLQGDALAVATRLRAGGVATEVYVGEGRLGKQLSWASQRGVPVCVIRGAEEVESGTVAVKDLRTGEQRSVPLDELLAHVAGLLGLP